MRIFLIGFGSVGQGFATILHDKETDLRERHNFTAKIIGVATRSRGTLYHPDGLAPDVLLEASRAGSFAAYPEVAGLQRDRDVLELIRGVDADVVIEASVTDLETAQPALDYCLAALESGKHIVLANKGPVALAYADLMQAAQRAGRVVRFEGTVMAGTPSLALALEALAGCTITEARGILNGTTNYILTQMEAGMSYTDALGRAQALGYAEADPTADVEGWDAAGKALILASVLFGRKLRLSDMEVTGISQITSEEIDSASNANERYKLIASVTPQGGSVKPVRLPLNDPLAGVGGGNNAITFTTDLLGDVTISGPGAGKLETGYALLADLLAIARSL